LYYNGKFWTDIYGGKFLENIIQALSRIVIRDHILKARTYLATIGGRIVLTVHDEIVSLIPTGVVEEGARRVGEIMRVCSSFCNDGTLVLDVEYGWDEIYSK
jgi:DNA polymerase